MMTVPFDNIEGVEVSESEVEGLLKGDLHLKGFRPALKLDWANFLEHVVLDKDLTLLGATVMARGIFAALVGYIERGEVRPLLAKTFRLEDLRTAQSEFLEKRHVGNFVVLPR